MAKMAQFDADAVYIGLQQTLAVLRTATQGVYKVESAASRIDNPSERDALLLNQYCRIDLRDARIMLEVAENLASEAYETISSAC